MIFVILGTQDKQFIRLVQEIEKLATEGIINKKVVVQAGFTRYKSEIMDIHQMIPMHQFLHYIEKSDFIITHGGVGSILDAMKRNKKVIAVPRLKEYGEHENDHQKQIVQKFTQENYIIGCQEVKELKEAVLKIDQFQPSACTFRNRKMVQQIETFIENKEPCRRKNCMIFALYTVIILMVQIMLYYLLRQFQNELDAIFCSWLSTYILLIQFAYPKRKHGFEILFGILLICSQILWLNLLKDSVILMFVSTLSCAFVTYIGHAIYYGGKR